MDLQILGDLLQGPDIVLLLLISWTSAHRPKVGPNFGCLVARRNKKKSHLLYSEFYCRAWGFGVQQAGRKYFCWYLYSLVFPNMSSGKSIDRWVHLWAPLSLIIPDSHNPSILIKKHQTHFCITNRIKENSTHFFFQL